MAFEVQSIASIFEQHLLEKQTLPSLSGLIDNGVTDIDTLIPRLEDGTAPDWVLWLYNQAVGGYLMELTLKTGVDDIQLKLDEQRLYSIGWWVKTILAYQFGDNLTIPSNNGVPYYDVINTSKQIIGSVAVTTLPSRIRFRVRKKDNTVLSSDERNGLLAYIFEIGPGFGTELVSYESDKFKIVGNIIYSGHYSLNVIRTKVESAINNYLNNLGSDGLFLRNKLIDAIQNVEGVIDPRITTIEVLNPLSITENISFEYLTASGWGEINPLYTLLDNLTYTAR